MLTPKATEKQLRSRAKAMKVFYESYIRGWRMVGKTKVTKENK